MNLGSLRFGAELQKSGSNKLVRLSKIMELPKLLLFFLAIEMNKNSMGNSKNILSMKPNVSAKLS